MTTPNPAFPAIFSCPVSRQPLDWQATYSGPVPDAWARLSSAHQLGNPVAYLATAGGASVYPAWANVLGLLPELRATTEAAGASMLADEKKGVAKFYDEFGWQASGDNEHFNDATAFEDLRPLTAFYRRRCHRRVNRYLPGGRFLLDVASGPVQIPEYRSFSQGYERRVCVDLSITGLLAAKRRLGDHAICVLGDITALPLRDGSMDNFVSLHTIYHVPAPEQATAVAELFRVLQAKRDGVIVYSWGSRAAINRWAERAARWVKPPASGAASTPLPEGLGLYFSPHDYAWYQREVAARYPTRLRIWRSVGKEFLQYFARGPLSAALVLWPLYLGEQWFPRLFGRIGICPMFVLSKQ